MSSEAPRRGRGRPPLPPEERTARETEIPRVRASRVERARWDAAVAAMGTTIAALTREALDAAADAAGVPHKLEEIARWRARQSAAGGE